MAALRQNGSLHERNIKGRRKKKTGAQVATLWVMMIALVAGMLPIITIQPATAAPASLAEIEDEVDQCVTNPATLELLDLINEIDLEEEEKGTWFMPVDVNDRANAHNGWMPFLGKERFEWFANVLPASYDPGNSERYDGLPPPAWWVPLLWFKR